jgi:ubiquinone/menaquinone biosynthesis C-methylase UbiE
MGLYEKYIFHPLLNVTMNRTLDVRQNLLQDITGDVLEVGIGAGTNLPFYQGRARSLSAIEPDQDLAKACLKKAQLLSLPINVMKADLSELESASFDAVVFTFVLCSVGDVSSILEQVRRVLRPEGRLYLLEHVQSQGAKRLAQRVVRPLWRPAFGRCDPSLNLAHELEVAGFSSRGLSSIKLEMPWIISSGLMGRLTLR